MRLPNIAENIIDEYLEDPLFDVRVEISERRALGTRLAVMSSDGVPDGVYMIMPSHELRLLEHGRQAFIDYLHLNTCVS